MQVAHARRMATTPMPQSHYDNGLWPNYCAYKDVSVYGTEKVHTVDGTLPPEEVLRQTIAVLAHGDEEPAFGPAAAASCGLDAAKL
jgi:hypothetical protein